jgi:hypothetical protein
MRREFCDRVSLPRFTWIVGKGQSVRTSTCPQDGHPEQHPQKRGSRLLRTLLRRDVGRVVGLRKVLRQSCSAGTARDTCSHGSVR